jgi:hypothetical protein
MKKIILSIFALGTLAMNAQDVTGFSKGNIALTTGLGYGTSTVGTAKLTNFSISPEVMYMMQNNWGLSGMIGFNSTSSNAPGAVSTSDFGIGAGLKHFFTPANRLSFYLGGDAMAMFGDGAANGAKGTQIMLNFRPGVNYFIHKNWTVGANLNLVSLSVTSPEVGDAETSLTVNPNSSFGPTSSSAASAGGEASLLGGINFKLSYVIK